VDAEAAARRWADTLHTAWPTGDIDSFIALYADEADYRTPLEKPERAIDHMCGSLAIGEPGPDVWVGEPLVSGDRAAVEWWAVIVIDGDEHSFAATSWLRFDDDGLVVEEHDYWRTAPGRIEPWEGWGSA
jgi:hypothetical protein